MLTREIVAEYVPNTQDLILAGVILVGLLALIIMSIAA
jgi:hypothetical protein